VIKLVSDFSHGISVFSNNKTDRHDINEILLKVALNTIKKKPLINIIQLFDYSFHCHTTDHHRSNELDPKQSQHKRSETFHL
jgi:hypothetical protein